VSLGLVALLAFGIVAYMFTSGYFSGYRDVILVPCESEKIAIQDVSYSPEQNSISIHAQAVNDVANNATFLYALVKDQDGNTVMTIPISDKLNGFELTTLTFNLTSTLPSGTYTATLTTAKGGSFVSPSFNVS
jgi:hypothetical protein